jgi:hypothetical protein
MSDETPKAVIHSVSAVDVAPNDSKVHAASRKYDVVMASEISDYTTVEEGMHGTLDFRAHFRAAGDYCRQTLSSLLGILYI